MIGVISGEMPFSMVPVTGVGRSGRSIICARFDGAASSVIQSESQPSPFCRLRSSHCSALSMMPSPQDAFLQVRRQASGRVLLFWIPSSQSSPVSMVPFPQKLGSTTSQRVLQGFPGVPFPMPLSHCSTWPSVFANFPSMSTVLSTVPFPQKVLKHPFW